MYRYTKYATNKGFSLLELLVVIFIVSLIYALGIQGFEKPEKKPPVLTPLNLKTNIIKSKFYQNGAKLLCVDKCRSCYFRKGMHGTFNAYSDGIDLYGIEAYTIDKSDSLVDITYGKYDKKKICLSIDFFPNGSSTQIILKNKKGVYFLPSYFGLPQKVDSLDEAKALWLENNKLLSDTGSFY